MFNKEEKPKFSPELPASPKTKNFADEVFLQVPKPEPVKNQPPAHADLSAESIIAEISRLPNQSAIFEPVEINTWNEVYVALSKLKLHTRVKWDEVSKVLKYR